MISKISTLLIAGFLASFMLVSPLVVNSFATSQVNEALDDLGDSGRTYTNAEGKEVVAQGQARIGLVVQDVIDILFWAIGIIAVIMIIVGGIMYATSMGDPGKAKKAKDAIMYGIVGLVIALLAFAIVRFVTGVLA